MIYWGIRDFVGPLAFVRRRLLWRVAGRMIEGPETVGWYRSRVDYPECYCRINSARDGYPVGEEAAIDGRIGASSFKKGQEGHNPCVAGSGDAM